MHEAPGITPYVARFGRLVAEAGFTAVLPRLFGTPGKPATRNYVRTQLTLACINREFHCFAKRHSSPITDWLRALCREVLAECGGKGVGAVGMCIAGGFALSLVVDQSVMAPVLSQPSLPFPLTAAHAAAIGISDMELTGVKHRIAGGDIVLGLRFTNDPLCRAERFATLRRELGRGFEAMEIDSSPGNPHNIDPGSRSF